MSLLEAQLKEAVRTLLPFADAWLEHHYSTPTTEPCDCRLRALDAMVVERARKLVEEKNVYI